MTRRIVPPAGSEGVFVPGPAGASGAMVSAQEDRPPPASEQHSEHEEPDRSNQPRPDEQFGSEFLDNFAHQMVAPLQSIEMHCTNILNGTVPENRRDARLKEVIGHARVLANLARRMRFLHELVSGKEIRSEQLPFDKVVTTWIDGFNNYLPIAKSVGIETDIDHLRMNQLPAVIASPLAVQQVVMNLYDNAIKYGKPGTRISVKARLEPPFVLNEFSHGANVILTEDAALSMFERGFRAPEARAMRASGTGVGMWISRRLMLAMQGDLRAIPTNSGVTRFVLSWRLAS